jgi:hypothetical protein
LELYWRRVDDVPGGDSYFFVPKDEPDPWSWAKTLATEKPDLAFLKDSTRGIIQRLPEWQSRVNDNTHVLEGEVLSREKRVRSDKGGEYDYSAQFYFLISARVKTFTSGQEGDWKSWP